MPIHHQLSAACCAPLRLCRAAALQTGRREGDLDRFGFLEKCYELIMMMRGRKVEEDMGYYRYPRSETKCLSPPWVCVQDFPLRPWNQRLVFTLAWPSDGSQPFQVTSYLLSEWKYLNACWFSSFKLFPPMFLLLGSKAAICTGHMAGKTWGSCFVLDLFDGVMVLAPGLILELLWQSWGEGFIIML